MYIYEMEKIYNFMLEMPYFKCKTTDKQSF